MKRVLVTGGRNYSNASVVEAVLTRLCVREKAPLVIIHGDATGLDRLAGAWAQRHGMPEVRVPAPWEHHGKAAGPMRNDWMLLLQPEICIAFPGGKGTDDMTRKAIKAGVPTFAPDYLNQLLPLSLSDDGEILGPPF
jgi:hypothetical protein